MTDNIHDNCAEIYNEKALEYPNKSKGVFLDDLQSQYFRFHEIVKHIDSGENTTILDVGCGNGELYKFLNFSGFKGVYTGYDLSDVLVDQARSRFPDTHFDVIDILETDVGHFDYVVASGIFNLNFGQTTEWVKKVIDQMYHIANKAVVFNAVSTYVNTVEDHMFYLNPLDVVDHIVRNLSANIVLEHAVLPYNFLIKIKKEKLWESING